MRICNGSGGRSAGAPVRPPRRPIRYTGRDFRARLLRERVEFADAIFPLPAMRPLLALLDVPVCSSRPMPGPMRLPMRCAPEASPS